MAITPITIWVMWFNTKIQLVLKSIFIQAQTWDYSWIWIICERNKCIYNFSFIFKLEAMVVINVNLNPLRQGVLYTTLCDKVCQWLAAGWWFSPGTPVTSTNKTDGHDITEILLKVALKHHNSNPYSSWCFQHKISVCFLKEISHITI